ncbi:MAG: hypothetical protein DCC67_07790 [Planctomycetota bacterium]|nr:MAG: hypothetical protein DCC67_07790 [Planctomycetota bacterium]
MATRLRLYALCLPPLALAVLDGALTLAGQSEAYWAGDYRQVNEMSPTFHHLLTSHPLAFAVGFAAWMAVFVGLILLLPATLALLVAIAVTFGHTAGAATWLLWRFYFGYQACNLLILVSALLLTLAIRIGWPANPTEAQRLLAARPLWRWTLIAALGALGVWLFLWPRAA